MGQQELTEDVMSLHQPVLILILEPKPQNVGEKEQCSLNSRRIDGSGIAQSPTEGKSEC